MSSEPIRSSGAAAWLPTPSNAGPPTLASELASPTVTAALQNAPGDIAQLTAEALPSQPILGPSSPSRLLELGRPSGAGSTVDGPPFLASEPSSAGLSGPDPAYELQLRARQLQSLFALAPPDGSTSNVLNLLA